MELQAIADKTHLSLRKLRYVLDHRLLPGLRVMVDGKSLGQPRYFTDYGAFGVACAAALLEGGLKREAIVHFVDGLCELTWEGPPYSDNSLSPNERTKRIQRIAWYTAFTVKAPALAMLGDGINVRVIVAERDTGWRQPRTLAHLGDDYLPRVISQLDLAQLRDQLLK